MEVSIYEAKANLSKFIQMIIDEQEEIIIISKNGKPVVQLTSIAGKNKKRLGAAKKEMSGFDISLEDFNSIKIEGFEKYLWNIC